MSFHPFIHIRIGDKELTTVPPEYVRSITFKSSIEAISTFGFEVVDPSFQDVEQALLLSDQASEPLVFRFGYADPVSGYIASNWVQARMINYVPELTHKGMRIVASFLIDLGATFANSSTRTYSGKISEIVKKIAADMGAEAEVEETNDDQNASNVDNRGSPKEWCTGNAPLFEFVGKQLLPIAQSKTGQSNYLLFVTGVGSRLSPPVLHFHTKEFQNCSSRKKRIKEFNYLANTSQAVLSFRPMFNSSDLGNLGGGQVVMRAVDPVTKQFVSSVQNDRNNPNSLAVGDGDKTNRKSPSEAGSGEDLATEVYHIVTEADANQASARARLRWELLKAFSYTAELSLVGLPETSDIEANDAIQVNVLIPGQHGSDVPYRSHWSSGLYFVTEAIHQIGEGSGYTVDCQLTRDVASRGSELLRITEYIPSNPT